MREGWNVKHLRSLWCLWPHSCIKTESIGRELLVGYRTSPLQSTQACVGPSFCFLDFKWKVHESQWAGQLSTLQAHSVPFQWQSWEADALRACVCLVHLPGPNGAVGTAPALGGVSITEQGIRILLGSRARWGRGRGQAGLGEPLRGCKDRSGMVRSLCWRNPFWCCC